MMRSMYTAVSGLRTHQGKMDTIGHNIANVNTVGYKKSQVTFKEAFSQMMSGASGPQAGRGGTNPQQVGLGVGTGGISVVHTTGGTQRTEKPTDLMINGEGFFTVSDDPGFANRFYTRDGSFGVDAAGNLVTSEGYKVLGYRFDKDGKRTDEPGNIVINKSETVAPSSTTGITFRGNLNANSKEPKETMTTFAYDSLGNQYELSFEAVKGETKPNKDVEWNIQLTRIKDVATGNYKAIDNVAMIDKSIENLEAEKAKLPSGDPEIANIDAKIADLKTRKTKAETDGIFSTKFKFNDKGNFIDPVSVNIDGDKLGAIKFDKNKEDETITEVGMPGTFNREIKIIDGDNPETYSNITQYANETDLKPFKNDGNSSGTLDGFTIDPSGVIMGKFTNGEQRALGQVMLTKFDNPMGLEKLGGNLFTETRNSGEPQYGVGGTRGFGSIQGGTLEMSNVDISFEFTEMITTQRGFQANSRVITTSDEMLQELVNIKR